MIDTRSLFEAARDDAPPEEHHDEMWSRIAGATGIAATAAAGSSAPLAAKAASFSAGKLLAIGGIIGAISTALGVVVALLVINPEATSSSNPVAASPGQIHSVAPGARLASPEPRKRSEGSAVRDQALGIGQGIKSETREGAPPLPEPTSDLAEEARLVTAARAALVGGDPQRALSLVRAARRLSSHALEPEELGLEARALAALGRTDEAAATDFLLRRQYPESALAR